MRLRASLPLLSCLTTVALAGCVTPPPLPPAYVPPSPGLVVTYAEVGEGASAGTPTLRVQVQRNIDDRVLNIVTPLPNGPSREVRSLRGLVAYQVWRPGQGIFVDDVRKNPVRDLWPLWAKNWSESDGPLYYGRGRTEKIALKAVRKTGTVKMTFDVLRREEVKVPAGTFQTYVIKRVSTAHNLDGSVRLTTERLYWWAPEIGWPVRMDTIVRKPGTPDKTMRQVAVTIVRPPKAR